MESKRDSVVQFEGGPRKFTYNELSEATGDFSNKARLGHGGFGAVYQGVLTSDAIVAIKKMNPAETQSQGMKEFHSEVQIISQVSHRNLIRLQGYCADEDRKEYMLVYDLMLNRSLEDALFNPAKETVPLSWTQKYTILVGTADGLAYLHHGSPRQIIHRDIKCSNILLDGEYNPKLGDFGIARMVDCQGRAKTTIMAGTLGYIAPEIFRDNQFTAKADVYAFGVVMLEVTCGRRVFPSASHQVGLVEWVSSANRKGKLLSAVDKRHRDDETKQLERVLKVALLCTQQNPEDRPSMKHVVPMLAGNMMVPSISTAKLTSGLPDVLEDIMVPSVRISNSTSRLPFAIFKNMYHKMVYLVWRQEGLRSGAESSFDSAAGSVGHEGRVLRRSKRTAR